MLRIRLRTRRSWCEEADGTASPAERRCAALTRSSNVSDGGNLAGLDFLESAFDTSCTCIWTNRSTLVSFLKVSDLISGQSWCGPDLLLQWLQEAPPALRCSLSHLKVCLHSQHKYFFIKAKSSVWSLEELNHKSLHVCSPNIPPPGSHCLLFQVPKLGGSEG